LGKRSADRASKIAALEQSLEKARCVASPAHFPDALSDAVVVERLLAAADAMRRSGRADEASAYMAEADEIAQHRKLPDSARRRGLAPSQPDFGKRSLLERLLGH